MRINGTKYESVEQLQSNALPISAFVRQYGKRLGLSSAAYVHVKYDRHKFGYYKTSGEKVYAPHPGYDIIDFHGSCYVINY